MSEGVSMGYQGDAEAFRQAMQQHQEIAMKIGWCQGETFDEALARYVAITQHETPAAQPTKTQELIDDIANAINKHSGENGSNTPDFILAEFLVRCLKAFDITSRTREKWYGKSLSIGGEEVRKLTPANVLVEWFMGNPYVRADAYIRLEAALQASRRKALEALTGYELAGCADRAGVILMVGSEPPSQCVTHKFVTAQDWYRFSEEIRKLAEQGQ